MVVQPSKTHLLGYKSRAVSKRENYPQRHGEHRHRVSQPTSLFPPIFISPLVSTMMWKQPAVCLTASVCVALCVSVCGLGGFDAAECVVLFPAALCLTYNEFVKQSVKIAITFKSFIREQILIISYPSSYGLSLFKGPLKHAIFVIYTFLLLQGYILF